MDTTTCISNDNWLAYSENKLGKDALMQLEQHVLHCEMCADIKGGIDTLARAQSLKKEVAILNNTVDEYLLTKKRRTLFWLYSGIAAGLIALAFLGWMLLHPIEKETAINTLLTESPNQISIEKEVQSDKNSNKETSAKTYTLNTKKTNKTPVNQIKTRDEINPEIDEIVPTPTAVKSQTNTQVESVTSITFDNEETKTSIDEKADVAALDNKDAANETVEHAAKNLSNKTAKTQDNVTQIEKVKPASLTHKSAPYPAPLLNNNSNYDYSNNTISNKFKNHFINDSISYAKAAAFFNNNLFDSSLCYLAYPIQNPLTPYYEDALFLKAKVMLNQHKNEEAKVLLNQIIILTKKHTKEAKKLLKEIK